MSVERDEGRKFIIPDVQHLHLKIVENYIQIQQSVGHLWILASVVTIDGIETAH